VSAATDKQALIVLAKTVAQRFRLDPALVCAVVEQESQWNQWAIRYEPGYMAKYIAPMYTNGKIRATEAYARSFSWGLMQLMGEDARELNADMMFLSQLCDPETNLSLGCEWLFREINAAKGDVAAGLLRWNGGADPTYPAQVLARKDKYQ
jgi:soluble lytic murein transglycosylase-like protein